MTEDLKARLLKPRVTEDSVEIDGIGTVRVRGLSRAEVFMTQHKDVAVAEAKIVALGLVDPPMTEAEVREWQRAAPGGELEPVIDKISELSGLKKGADKSGVPDVRDDAGA